MYERTRLKRAAEAVMIPSGDPIVLDEGSEATITQSLGGSYTLITDRGMMVRLSGTEVEAIGKEPLVVAKLEGDVTKDGMEKLVWDQFERVTTPRSL